MSKISELIYSFSPACAQNILISAYGYKLYTQRYTGSVAKQIQQDLAYEKSLTDVQKLTHQTESMSEMLKYCHHSIPYYQKVFSDYGFNPSQFTKLSDLQKLPILDKQILKSNSHLFTPTSPSRLYDSKVYMTQTTSGSTGTPLKLQVNEYTYKLAMALLIEHEENCGIKFGAPRATFAGRLIQPIENNKKPFWRYNKAENQYLFSSYHLNKNNFNHYRNSLDKIKPEEIIGYPSAIAELASLYQLTKATPKFQPKGIITNSETLLSWQRERIESVFNCQVFDYYGTAEYVTFAGQDKNGLYKPNTLLGYMELVDSTEDKETKEVIASSLCNTAMPLIRYKLGDTAVAKTGENDLVIEEFKGRIDDYVIKPDGTKIGRIDHIFKGVTGIKEAQIIQNSQQSCTIKLVKLNSENYNEQQLLDNFHQRLGIDMQLKIEMVANIPRGKNGKFKAVIGIQ